MHNTGEDDGARHSLGAEATFTFSILDIRSQQLMVCRWAQWLAGLDVLPQLPAGLHFQGIITDEALQSALACYRRERRATHILYTLLKRAEESSELG